MKGVPKATYIGVGGAVFLVVAASVAWAVLRDTWESDNGVSLKEIAQTVVTLSKAGQLQECVSKGDELAGLVGERQIRDPGLRQGVGEAMGAAKSAKQRLERERIAAEKKRRETENLATLKGLEAQATAFVDSGDLARAVEKFQQALDHIKNSQTDNQEFATAIGRISQAKTVTSAKLEQIRLRQEEERKRVQEEERMASVRATVKGGAWLTKKAGNSETLRGLKIYAIRSPAKNEQYVALLQAILVGTMERLKADKAKVATDEKWARDYPSNSGMQDSLRSSKRVLELREDLVTSIRRQLDQASKDQPSAPVDMIRMYRLMPSDGVTENEAKTWAAVCSQQSGGDVHTDVDGKYQIELQGGHYYMYATFESSYSLVEWFVAAKVSEAKDVKVDFHNGNAASIENKNN